MSVAKGYRIALRPERNDPRPDVLDDVVVKDVSMFRAEMMDDRSLWLCCYLAGTDERIVFYATAKRGKLILTVTEHPMGDFLYEDDTPGGAA